MTWWIAIYENIGSLGEVFEVEARCIMAYLPVLSAHPHTGHSALAFELVQGPVGLHNVLQASSAILRADRVQQVVIRIMDRAQLGGVTTQ